MLELQCTVSDIMDHFCPHMYALGVVERFVALSIYCSL